MVQETHDSENQKHSGSVGSIATVEVELTGGEPESVLRAAVQRVLSAGPDSGGTHVTYTAPLTAQIDMGRTARIQLMVGEAVPTAAHPAGTHVLMLSLHDEGHLSHEQQQTIIKALRRVPFSQSEIAAVAAQMPLTHTLRERIADRPLTGTVLLIMAHYLEDLTGMVQSAMDLGAAPDCLVVVDKGYQYKNRDRVEAHLAELGITSFHSSDITRALAWQIGRARERGHKAVIIDDGGYALPALMDSMPDHLASVNGLVEQTMSGIFKLEPYEDKITTPIFSVAQSRMKGTIESYWIADAAVRRIMDLMPPYKVEGQPALVIGYGQVGSEIAQILSGLRMRVAVYDRELIRMIVAHESGYVTGRDLPGLIRSHQPILIIGATGRQAITPEHLPTLPQECFLASVTSRDGEFPLPSLGQAAVSVEDEQLAGTTYTLPHGARVTVLAHGFPVNFHFAESIRNRHSDLTLAALLVGACTLARDDHGFTPGHNVERTDRILQRSQLLEDYYALYGPAAQTEVQETRS